MEKKSRKEWSRVLQAASMTRRVIAELRRKSLERRETLDTVIEPEIQRMDALERASMRLVVEDPQRWQTISELYQDLADSLREEALDLEEEITVQEALVEALLEDLRELESPLEGSDFAGPELEADAWRMSKAS